MVVDSNVQCHIFSENTLKVSAFRVLLNVQDSLSIFIRAVLVKA